MSQKATSVQNATTITNAPNRDNFELKHQSVTTFQIISFLNAYSSDFLRQLHEIKIQQSLFRYTLEDLSTIFSTVFGNEVK